MKAYSISYDLNKTGKNYDGLIDAIKEYGTWCACTKSYWLIATNDSAEMIYQKLKAFLDDDDHIFIMRISGDSQGWLSKTKWEWIHQNVPKFALA